MKFKMVSSALLFFNFTLASSLSAIFFKRILIYQISNIKTFKLLFSIHQMGLNINRTAMTNLTGNAENDNSNMGNYRINENNDRTDIDISDKWILIVCFVGIFGFLGIITLADYSMNICYKKIGRRKREVKTIFDCQSRVEANGCI